MNDITQDARQVPAAVADATERPCPTCGETVVIAYVGIRRNYALVRCFEGHPQCWVPWPDWAGNEPKEFDS